jgi:hypothetical protein
MRRFSFLVCLLLGAFGCGGGGGGGVTKADPLPDGVKGKWTVLVYMNAANDLYRYSPINMNQIEQVAGNPAVRFVVQWKQSQGQFPDSTFNGTRRYLAYPDDANDSLRSHLLANMGNGVDMGAWQTLQDFVVWGKQHYPADHYVLVIWNHGNGWLRKPVSIDNGRAVSYDDETGHAIQIWDLSSALAGQGISTVAFDASLMQMAEVAYELKQATPLVAGSEESPPGEGYPYQNVFRGYQDHPDLTPAALSKGFVDGMLSNPDYSTRKITESVIDTSKLGNVAFGASVLAQQLIQHPELSAQIDAARSSAQGYSVTASRHYYDLIGFCQSLQGRTALQDVQQACAALSAGTQSAIVWEGHNANSAGSHGLAIDLSRAGEFAPVATDYSQMRWAKNTGWDEWLSVAP